MLASAKLCSMCQCHITFTEVCTACSFKQRRDALLAQSSPSESPSLPDRPSGSPSDRQQPDQVDDDEDDDVTDAVSLPPDSEANTAAPATAPTHKRKPTSLRVPTLQKHIHKASGEFKEKYGVTEPIPLSPQSPASGKRASSPSFSFDHSEKSSSPPSSSSKGLVSDRIAALKAKMTMNGTAHLIPSPTSSNKSHSRNASAAVHSPSSSTGGASSPDGEDPKTKRRVSTRSHTLVTGTDSKIASDTKTSVDRLKVKAQLDALLTRHTNVPDGKLAEKKTPATASRPPTSHGKDKDKEKEKAGAAAKPGNKSPRNGKAAPASAIRRATATAASDAQRGGIKNKIANLFKSASQRSLEAAASSSAATTEDASASSTSSAATPSVSADSTSTSS